MSLQNPKFSIIVPAYNAQDHIQKCLESIAFQQYRDFELIVVCDSCTDETENLAKMYRYGAKTDNVQFGRDGLTRDRGLEMANGDWILFCDDDDWFVHEYVLQILADTIKRQTEVVDIIAFGYLCKGRGYVPPSEQTIFNPGDAHVWSNCWKRSSIIGAKFGDAVFCSDTYFIRDVKRRTRNYVLLDQPLYYYNFKRPGSQTDKLIRGEIRQSPVAR